MLLQLFYSESWQSAEQARSLQINLESLVDTSFSTLWYIATVTKVQGQNTSFNTAFTFFVKLPLSFIPLHAHLGRISFWLEKVLSTFVQCVLHSVWSHFLLMFCRGGSKFITNVIHQGLASDWGTKAERQGKDEVNKEKCHPEGRNNPQISWMSLLWNHNWMIEVLIFWVPRVFSQSSSPDKSPKLMGQGEVTRPWPLLLYFMHKVSGMYMWSPLRPVRWLN